MKRRYYALFFFLAFASCQQEAKTDGNEPTKEKTEQESTTESEIVANDIALEEDEAPRTFDYYAGTIGLYGEDVLMEINQDELTLSGRYWYLKHGRQISIEGAASAKSSEWQLTESLNNVVTGYMTLQLENGTLTGQWYAPGKKSELQKVVMRKVLTSDTGQIQPKFEDFSRSKVITMYNSDTDEATEDDVSDDIRLVRIGEYVLFQYFVIGPNAHVGHINGLAKFKSKNKAIFTGEEGCQLSLDFSKNEVIIREDTSCSYYRGMRAHFDGTLKKRS